MRRIGLSAALLLSAFPIATGCSTSDSTDASSANQTAGTCSEDQQYDKLMEAIAKPIDPGHMTYGGLDLRGGDAWTGLTIDAAERVLCGSHAETENEGTVSAGWTHPAGPDDVITVSYDKTTRNIDYLQMSYGYRGKLEFRSRAGNHAYSFGVGQPLLRDGQEWALDWNNIGPQMDEIQDGVLATFAPEMPFHSGCIASGDCVAAKSGIQGYLGVRPLGIYFAFPDVTLDQPAASTPNQAYAFMTKNLPASRARVNFKLDAEGPVASATALGDRHTACTMKLGMAYSAFLDGCVRVMDSQSQSDAIQAKAEGGVWRTTDAGAATWRLAVDGTRPSFTSERFDETKPIPTAKATELILDVRSGQPANDYDGSTITFAGTGAVLKEYARLIHEDPRRQSNAQAHAFGDPTCAVADGHPAAAGCTGMELFVAPGPVAAAAQGMDAPMVLAATDAFQRGFRSAINPGNPRGVFGTTETGFEGGMLFKESLDRVTAAMGSTRPAAAGELDYYVRFWGQALVTYLQGAPPAAGELTVETPTPDGMTTVRFKNKLTISLIADAANIQRMTFR